MYTLSPSSLASPFLLQIQCLTVPKEEIDGEVVLDSARSSFSLALKGNPKRSGPIQTNQALVLSLNFVTSSHFDHFFLFLECQDRRSRSEALSKKLDRRRPASLDLNNVTAASPRLGTIKKASMTSRKSGTFPSPGTPNYRHASAVMQKGWSSERVPLHANAGRKGANSALLPFNNGRTLPSKWEDAERWILSPVAGDGVTTPSLQQPQRKPKSKSGPLGPPGIAYYSLYSPTLQTFDGGNVGNFMAASPFSAGVIAADGMAIRPSGHGVACAVRTEPCMARSVSVHGCSEAPNQSPFPADQGTTTFLG